MSRPDEPTPLLPWREQPPGTTDDEPLRLLLSALPEVTPLPDNALERVRQRLAGQPGAVTRRGRLGFRLAPAFAAILIGATAAAAGFGTNAFVTHLARSAVQRSDYEGKKTQTKNPRRERLTTPTQGVNAMRPVPDPPVGKLDPALAAHSASTERSAGTEHSGDTAGTEHWHRDFTERTPKPARSLDPPHAVALERHPGAKLAKGSGASSAERAESELTRESELLGRALVALRQENDAAKALALLDQHDATFPEGTLRDEAKTTRVEALLRLGNRKDALQELSRLPLNRLGRGDELSLLRAELYSEADCPRAVQEFDAVLRRSLTTPLLERALYGRAACRLQLQDELGARADLLEYQRRFPDGRFSHQVRARLMGP